SLLPVLDDPLRLDDRRFIINPGSVGQPRDGDYRASYALLDTEQQAIRFCRVAYPIETTQEQMQALEMPPRLIARLSYGW
ncbi:MAG: metallophosphoesterase, partial [Chloroflexi bacterium]|nr:metallophosphoesterase [Chloroflexota bacterium]